MKAEDWILAIVLYIALDRMLRAYNAGAGGALPPGAFNWTTADQEDADAGRYFGAGALIGQRPPAGSTWSESQAGWVERDAAGNILGTYT